MPRGLRLLVSILACVLGPALAGLTVGLCEMAMAALTRPESAGLGGDPVQGSAFYVVVAVTFGAPSMLAIGLPLQALMARRGITGLWWHVAPATLAGIVIFLLVVQTVDAEGLTMSALVGGLAGFYAWMIRRPDRDHMFDALFAAPAAQP